MIIMLMITDYYYCWRSIRPCISYEYLLLLFTLLIIHSRPGSVEFLF